MRIRTIKPAFWTSETVAGLPDDTHRLAFIGLWNYVDDFGVGPANPKLIKAALFPLTDHTLEQIAGVLEVLDEAGMIRLWVGPDGRRYLHIPSWGEHQVISHKAKKSVHPTPPPLVLREASGSDTGGPLGGREVGREVGRENGSAEPVVNDLDVARRALRGAS